MLRVSQTSSTHFQATSAQAEGTASGPAGRAGAGLQGPAVPKASQGKRVRTAKAVSREGAARGGEQLAVALPSEKASAAAGAVCAMMRGAGVDFKHKRQWDSRAVSALDQSLAALVQVCAPPPGAQVPHVSVSPH